MENFTPPTQAELDALKALCEKVEPGPWSVHFYNVPGNPVYALEAGEEGDGSEFGQIWGGGSPEEWDAQTIGDFIAASRNELPRLIIEVERLRRADDKWNGCPCRHTEPCSPECTCVNGNSSAGCSRCATYGSPEQQKHAAERLVRLTKEVEELRAQNGEGAEAFEQLAHNFPAIQYDCDNPIQAAQLINKEVEELRKDKERLAAIGLLWSATFQKYESWRANGVMEVSIKQVLADYRRCAAMQQKGKE